MSFIEALSNETTRSLIEQIEELLDTECSTLLAIRDNLIKELSTLGYDYAL